MRDLVPAFMMTCICSSSKTPCSLCCGRLCFGEKGKRVMLKPKRGENALALVLDQCVFSDNKLKCDGLFVLCRPNRSYVFLVELKGNEIWHAYQQISHVMKKRPEYKLIVGHVHEICAGRPVEKSFIISNRTINLKEKQELEKAWKIRPILIANQKPTSKAPDLRKYIGPAG